MKNKAAQQLGALGGAAGKGASKRRSKEHYQKAAKARWEKDAKKGGYPKGRPRKGKAS